jgi:hypothetical protein
MRRSRIDRRGVAATYFRVVPNRGVEVASGDWMALLDVDTSGPREEIKRRTMDMPASQAGKS